MTSWILECCSFYICFAFIGIVLVSAQGPKLPDQNDRHSNFIQRYIRPPLYLDMPPGDRAHRMPSMPNVMVQQSNSPQYQGAYGPSSRPRLGRVSFLERGFRKTYDSGVRFIGIKDESENSWTKESPPLIREFTRIIVPFVRTFRYYTPPRLLTIGQPLQERVSSPIR